MGGTRVVVYAFVTTMGEGAADGVDTVMLLLSIGRIGIHARTTAIMTALDTTIAPPATHMSRYEEGFNSVFMVMAWSGGAASMEQRVREVGTSRQTVR